VGLRELRQEGQVVIETVRPELLLRHLRTALRLQPYEQKPSWVPKDKD
jgi:hypothetical protein